MSDRATVKAYFETGDKPTQAQFADLIDSAYFPADDGTPEIPIFSGGEGGITAHAGGGQGDAYQLTKKVNLITTCATEDDSVKLPALDADKVGDFVIMKNTGAQKAVCYPATDQYIDGVQNAAIDLPPGVAVVFYSVTNNHWISSKEYAVS